MNEQAKQRRHKWKQWWQEHWRHVAVTAALAFFLGWWYGNIRNAGRDDLHLEKKFAVKRLRGIAWR